MCCDAGYYDEGTMQAGGHVKLVHENDVKFRVLVKCREFDGKAGGFDVKLEHGDWGN